MAHQWQRQSLLQSSFPFLTDLWGSSLSAPGPDISETDENNSAKMFYCENVMPSAEGYQSITMNSRVIPPTSNPGDFDQIYNITYPNAGYSPTSTVAVINCLAAISYTVGNRIYILDGLINPTIWVVYATPYTSSQQPYGLTTSFVNGLSYMWMAYKGMMHYDHTVPGMVADAVSGLTVANVIGITNANGYNIAYTKSAVAWSSLVNPLDFTPSLVTGSGGGNIAEIKGSIVCCFNISGGFLIYCTGNIVQASYTGNVQAPFKFQEIPNSGGITDQRQVAWQNNSSSHYAWTNKGLQVISIGSEAQAIAPAIEEYLTCGYYEVMDPVTFVISRVTFTNPYSPLVTLVAGQYLVVSLPGQQDASGNFFVYKQAIIFDLVFQRYGKIVRDHSDVAELNIDQSATMLANTSKARNNLAFMDNTGTTKTVNFKFEPPGGPSNTEISYIIFGRYQLQRNKGVYYQGVEMDNAFSTSTTTTYAIPSLNGKTLQTARQLIQIEASDTYQRYGGDGGSNGRIYGKNLNILVVGRFNLVSLAVNLQLGADFA